MLDGCKVSRRVLFADAAFIVAKEHVHHPVETVFDPPMAPDGLGKSSRIGLEGGDVVSGLAFAPARDLADAFDHDDALKPWPVVAGFEPGDIVNRRRCSRLDAPVAFFYRVVGDRDCIGEAFRLLLGEEQLNIVTKRSLIAFQR